MVKRTDIEDITWPCGDMKFLFEGNKWNIFNMKYQTIPLKLFFCCERYDLLCSHSNGDLFTYSHM